MMLNGVAANWRPIHTITLLFILEMTREPSSRSLRNNISRHILRQLQTFKRAYNPKSVIALTYDKFDLSRVSSSQQKRLRPRVDV